MAEATLTVASGDAGLSVRRFSVREQVSTPFHIDLWAVSVNASLDLSSIVGSHAALTIHSGYAFAQEGRRRWSGICSAIEQVRAVSDGQASTYHLQIVPDLWLLTQSVNYGIFQHRRLPDIVGEVLLGRGIAAHWNINPVAHPPMSFKVQYGESDLAFISRALEDAGIAYVFADQDDGSTVELDDALHDRPLRGAKPLPFAGQSPPFFEECVHEVHLSQEVRADAYTLRDYDLRNPRLNLVGQARTGLAAPHEHYDYRPGGSLIEMSPGAALPEIASAMLGSGDLGLGDLGLGDLGPGDAMHDFAYANVRAAQTLASLREGDEQVEFTTNAIDLKPGSVFQMTHPHPRLAGKLLVTRLHIEGSVDGEWTMKGRAVFADKPYRPPRVTPRPRVFGVQSATVVGPPGEEVFTDALGRCCVKFPWDRRLSIGPGNASCWIRDGQGWAGTGYGMQHLPRIGQEVLVAFLDGDPDQPVVVGRLHNAVQPVAPTLPEHRTVSLYKSESSVSFVGHNQLLLDDRAGDELVSIVAEKKDRRWVKHDETITVVHDYTKKISGQETETTDADRVEVTTGNRFQKVRGKETVAIHDDDRTRVGGDSVRRLEGHREVLGERDVDGVVIGNKREKNGGEVHVVAVSDQRRRIGGKLSVTVIEKQHEKVSGSHALEAGADVSVHANENITGEADDITIQGPGGFIRIDAQGVTIKGTLVEINTGGSPGTGIGCEPEEPEEPEIEEDPPPRPEPDAVPPELHQEFELEGADPSARPAR